MLREMKFIRRALLLVLLALVVVQGCRRKSVGPPVEPPAVPSPTPATQSSPAGQAPPATPVARPKDAVLDRLPTAPNDSSLRLPTDQGLTGAIHLYVTDHQKLPLDFETLVKEKYLKTMPKPPPGKRFALDRNRLQVVITD